MKIHSLASLLLLGLALSLALALASCGTINSGLNIAPGQEFRLGENEHGSFSVFATNAGAVAVTVLEEAVGGERVELATLVPGASVEQRFRADTIAIFLNSSQSPARLDVKIVGDTNLSMGYAAEPPASAGG